MHLYWKNVGSCWGPTGSESVVLVPALSSILAIGFRVLGMSQLASYTCFTPIHQQPPTAS